MVALPLSPDEASRSLLASPQPSSEGRKAKVPRGVWLAGILFALFLAAGLASRHEAVSIHLHSAGSSLSAASKEGWEAVGGTWSAWTSGGSIGDGTTPVPAEDSEEPSIEADVDEGQGPPEELEDIPDGPHEITSLAKVDESLPVCRRTFLYEMSITVGFAGQFVILSQAMTVASAYNYTLIPDDRKWNYGAWTDYFDPIVLDCRPPPDFLDVKRVNVGNRRVDFKRANHVFGPVGISALQELTISLTTNRTFINEQHVRDIEAYPPALPLSGEDTVPSFFHNAFKTESDLLKGIWKPNAEIKRMITAQREAFGWPEVREARQEGGARGDYIIAISPGANRAGDKCHETSSLKASPLRFAPKGSKKKPTGVSCGDSEDAVRDNRSLIFFSAAAGEVNLAMEGDQAGKTMANDSMAHWEQAAGERKPTFAIMSDNNHMKTLMEGHPNSGHWDLIQTENVDDPTLNNGFIGGGGFSALSRERKVAATRPMVRDLTLLAERADGQVFTGTSNVGRVFALLAGFDKARNGMLRSADMRWYPSSHFYR